jgi:hypothetical protein
VLLQASRIGRKRTRLDGASFATTTSSMGVKRTLPWCRSWEAIAPIVDWTFCSRGQHCDQSEKFETV